MIKCSSVVDAFILQFLFIHYYWVEVACFKDFL